MPTALACPLVLSGQEIHLNRNLPLPNRHVTEKDIRMPSLLLVVAAAAQQLLDPRIPVGDLQVIEGQIYIHAANMGAWLLGEEQLRHPAANEDNVVTIFPQEVRQLNQDRSCGLYRLGSIVPPCYHAFLITPSMSAEAASSPRP